MTIPTPPRTRDELHALAALMPTEELELWHRLASVLCDATDSESPYEAQSAVEDWAIDALYAMRDRNFAKARAYLDTYEEADWDTDGDLGPPWRSDYRGSCTAGNFDCPNPGLVGEDWHRLCLDHAEHDPDCPHSEGEGADGESCSLCIYRAELREYALRG